MLKFEVRYSVPRCTVLLGLSEEREPEVVEMFWNQVVVTMISASEAASSLQPVIIWLGRPNKHSQWFEKVQRWATRWW